MAVAHPPSSLDALTLQDPPPHDEQYVPHADELPAYHPGDRQHDPYSPGPRQASVGATGSGRAERSEHVYSLKNRHDKPWVTLRVKSRAQSSTFLPHYFEGDDIAGSVELDIEGEETISSVSIGIVGQLGSSSIESIQFLKHEEILWSTAMGDPRAPRPSSRYSDRDGSSSRGSSASHHSNTSPARDTRSPSARSDADGGDEAPPSPPVHSPSSPFSPAGLFRRISSSSRPTSSSAKREEKRQKHNGKLSGRYSWNFSMNVPKSVTLEVKGEREAKAFDLPPSFAERSGVRVTIQYDLVVKVRRGAVLSHVTKLGTYFGYTPVTQPPPASALRQLAYQESLPTLFGPESDPEGFERLPPIKITGRVFDEREVAVDCSLYVAKPLIYTRGTPLPFHLMLSGSDSQALDLFSAPGTMARAVQLTRTVMYDPQHLDPINGKPKAKPPPNPGKAPAKDGPPAIEYKTVTHHVAPAAIWAAADEGSPTAGTTPGIVTRYFDGEIMLPNDLKPSARLLNFELSYSLAVFPPQTPFFQPSTDADEPLIAHEVQVATAYARGPRPRALAPPGYDAPDRARYNAPMSQLASSGHL